MHETSGCRYEKIDRQFSVEELAAFHGHLGPYLVIGYRMGRYAKNYFCGDPWRLKCTVYCSGTPPESCLADGIQAGSGCTLGKRNIEIATDGEVRCVFEFGEKQMALRPKPFELPKHRNHHYEEIVEGIAEDMYAMRDDELFSVSSR